MRMVHLTAPNGSQVLVNAEEVHTVMPAVGAAQGAHTQIGFSGASSAIFVQETLDVVIQKLTEREQV